MTNDSTEDTTPTHGATNRDEMETDTPTDAPESVAIEGRLPLTAIDIESQKDMKSGRYHALRSLHKWFAARPTPAARLAVLASVYPGEIDPDELLSLMQIGPKAREGDIADYVEAKFRADRTGSGTLDDHYGYPNPNTQSPTAAELEELHETLREAWGGDLPTVLDPTAGRGIIPFEAMRYGLPAVANELNPVPSLILKAGLEFAPEVGSLEPEIRKWRDEIHETAKANLAEYYPTEEPGREILNSAFTYLIECDSCGGQIPLVKKWWLNKTADGGDAIRPHYEDGEVSYEHVKVQHVDYDPGDGPLTRQSAECPHCGYPAEEDEIKRQISEGEFEYSIYGVNYESETGDREYRAGSSVDANGMERARERVESDFELMTFLTEPIDVSSRISDPRMYGMDEWRDIFTPLQLVTHFEYKDAFERKKKEIVSEYGEHKAEAILTLLSFAALRCINFNSRLTKWRDSRGYGGEMFADNNYGLKRMSVENNLAAPRRGYINHSDHVIDSYEELVSYDASGSGEALSGDAAQLTSKLENGSVDVAVVDPPYYSSVMYSELSDVFYVIQKEYLGDIFHDLHQSQLTNKSDEAVSNPYRFEDLADDDTSKNEMADNHYENKMAEIFSEVQSLLPENGVMTVMFTHREMDAWDTLTKALIRSGLVITATHPIKTEMSDRIVVQGDASAESSILLVARKRSEGDDATVLWTDVRERFNEVAREQAESILDSGYAISKTDTAIAAYGPTLKEFAEAYPVVEKTGEEVRPRKALGEAREAVTSVIAERFLDTEGIETLDDLTRWYVLAWLIYESDTMPYDEGLQLGRAADVDIDDIRPTKLWRGGQEVELQAPAERVQDPVRLRDDGVDDPSSRKYPVDPTDHRFTYVVDAVHAVARVYDREGADAAWQWLTERNKKSDDSFAVAITALLEVLPAEASLHETLRNLVSGETGEYLDIDLDHVDLSAADRQSELGETFD